MSASRWIAVVYGVCIGMVVASGWVILDPYERYHHSFNMIAMAVMIFGGFSVALVWVMDSTRRDREHLAKIRKLEKLFYPAYVCLTQGKASVEVPTPQAAWAVMRALKKAIPHFNFQGLPTPRPPQEH